METLEVATVDQTSQPLAVSVEPRTATELINQAQIIQDVLKKVMKEGVDYDVIPGTHNKSLLKPGTEKILATFRLAADPEIIDLSTDDEIRYRVNARLISPTGVFVGCGIGECSSNEEKYKWRAMLCQEEFDETDKMRRRAKWKKNYNTRKPERVYQIRTEPADIANTVLKMAKKRALADAVLTATACSDIFDRSEEGSASNSNWNRNKRPARNPTPAKAPSSTANVDAAQVITALETKANEGIDALNEAWAAISNDERQAVGKEWFRLKKLAENAF